MLGKIATVVGGSCKRKEFFRVNQHKLLEERIVCGQVETGKGLNQERVVKRPGDTRWDSHYGTIYSVIQLFLSVVCLMNFIREEPKNDITRTYASTILYIIEHFEFAFLLHMMHLILGVTFDLSQALRKEDQNLSNVTHLIRATKIRIQNFRDDGFEDLLGQTIKFYNLYDIDIPNMNDNYCPKGRPRRRAKVFTFLHYCKVDIFNTVVDAQLQELNERFDNVNSMLIECVGALDPRNSFASFNIEKVLELAKMYSLEFNEEHGDLSHLIASLNVFIIDVKNDCNFANLKEIGELAQKMIENKMNVAYPNVYLSVKLALILSVATDSVERVFSSMNYVKDKLSNRMGDDWFNTRMVTYVEHEVFDTIEDEDII